MCMRTYIYVYCAARLQGIRDSQQGTANRELPIENTCIYSLYIHICIIMPYSTGPVGISDVNDIDRQSI